MKNLIHGKKIVLHLWRFKMPILMKIKNLFFNTFLIFNFNSLYINPSNFFNFDFNIIK